MNHGEGGFVVPNMSQTKRNSTKASEQPKLSADSYSSRLRHEDLPALRKSCCIPSAIEIRIPAAGDVPRRPPPGFVAIHAEQIRGGARLPLHPFLQRVLSAVNLCPAQLHPNSYRSLVGCYVLWKKLGLSELSWPEFLHMYELRPNPAFNGTFHFKARDYNLIRKLPDSDKKWRFEWFYVPITCIGYAPFAFREAATLPDHPRLEAASLAKVERARASGEAVRDYRELLAPLSLASAGWTTTLLGVDPVSVVSPSAPVCVASASTSTVAAPEELVPPVAADVGMASMRSSVDRLANGSWPESACVGPGPTHDVPEPGARNSSHIQEEIRARLTTKRKVAEHHLDLSHETSAFGPSLDEVRPLQRRREEIPYRDPSPDAPSHPECVSPAASSIPSSDALKSTFHNYLSSRSKENVSRDLPSLLDSGMSHAFDAAMAFYSARQHCTELAEKLRKVELERDALAEELKGAKAAFDETKTTLAKQSQALKDVRAQLEHEQTRGVKLEQEFSATKASIPEQLREAAAKAVSDFKRTPAFVIQYWLGMADCRDYILETYPECRIDFSFTRGQLANTQPGTKCVDSSGNDQSTEEGTMSTGFSGVTPLTALSPVAAEDVVGLTEL